VGWQHSGRPNHIPPLFLPIKTGGQNNKGGIREGRTRTEEHRGED